MAQVGESSVEEILESIKNVIARDTPAGIGPLRHPPEARGISITQPGGETAREAEDVLDLTEPDTPYGQSDDDPLPENAPLVTPQARESMRESLAALAMMAEPRMPPRIVRSGETSLEDMARELLRPALAEWLDKNLPPIVERLVATEIARIVGKKG